MNRLLLSGLGALSIYVAAASPALAQVAGSTTLGVAVADVQVVASGWSAKKHILGQVVYNEAGEEVGKVDDLIISPDRAVSFAIVGAGGFVGVRRHEVAIPVEMLSQHQGQLRLVGATKAAIKALPAFEYEE